MRYCWIVILLSIPCLNTEAQPQTVKITTIGLGWANNSINTVVFRKNSLVTYKNIQYAGYYDDEGFMMLAKRRTGGIYWQIARTQYQVDPSDAHKTIAIMADGNGYLHVAWGHHNQQLNYAVSLQPGSLQLSARKPMTGIKENKVTYPEFYRLTNGDLLFLYRDGASGNGNMMMNRYDLQTGKWLRAQDSFIDGEGKRNAYWQLCTDNKGTIHISWVWRESPDVASNHDLCYARSRDGGLTWERSNGEKYQLPITAANAEVIKHIPQNRELINQTSMVADAAGHVLIASYWRDSGQIVPQYHIVSNLGSRWRTNSLGFRKTTFSLNGAGTKSIPISRPQIIAWQQGKHTAAALIFRDAERRSEVSMALTSDLSKSRWRVTNLTNFPVDEWEPTYDTELWRNDHVLNLFIQRVAQPDGEGKANLPPQPVRVLEWRPQ